MAEWSMAVVLKPAGIAYPKTVIFCPPDGGRPERYTAGYTCSCRIARGDSELWSRRFLNTAPVMSHQ